MGDTILHGLHVKHRVLCIDSHDGLAHCRGQGTRLDRRAKEDVEGPVRKLVYREVDYWLCILFQAVIPDVLHNAHNRRMREIRVRLFWLDGGIESSAKRGPG